MFLKFVFEIEDKINIKILIKPKFRTPPRLKGALDNMENFLFD